MGKGELSFPREDLFKQKRGVFANRVHGGGKHTIPLDGRRRGTIFPSQAYRGFPTAFQPCGVAAQYFPMERSFYLIPPANQIPALFFCQILPQGVVGADPQDGFFPSGERQLFHGIGKPRANAQLVLLKPIYNPLLPRSNRWSEPVLREKPLQLSAGFFAHGRAKPPELLVHLQVKSLCFHDTSCEPLSVSV